MPTVRLTQILEPAPESHLLERPAAAVEDLGPFVLGTGDLDLVCGKCDKLLAGGLDADKKLSDIVFKCQACGTYNEIGD
jgi:hypothetical protein